MGGNLSFVPVPDRKQEDWYGKSLMKIVAKALDIVKKVTISLVQALSRFNAYFCYLIVVDLEEVCLIWLPKLFRDAVSHECRDCMTLLLSVAISSNPSGVSVSPLSCRLALARHGERDNFKRKTKLRHQCLRRMERILSKAHQQVHNALF